MQFSLISVLALAYMAAAAPHGGKSRQARNAEARSTYVGPFVFCTQQCASVMDDPIAIAKCYDTCFDAPAEFDMENVTSTNTTDPSAPTLKERLTWGDFGGCALECLDYIEEPLLYPVCLAACSAAS